MKAKPVSPLPLAHAHLKLANACLYDFNILLSLVVVQINGAPGPHVLLGLSKQRHYKCVFVFSEM